MERPVTAKAMDEDGAARWAVRRDAGPLAPEEHAALDAWLAADERREGALLRAEAALAYLDRGCAMANANQADANQATGIETDKPPLFSRRGFLAASALTGTAAAGLTGLMLLSPGREFTTAVGEVRRLPLADGSVATINTASRIAVAMQSEQRHVALEDGEAWFQVAHDARRPFVVDAGDVRVRAIGTAFSVRRHADGVDVLVTEGVVETWRVGREAERIRVASGKRAFVTESASRIVAVKADEEIERALAWRSGGLALNGEPLSYAVAELNRYNQRQLIVEDPVLGRTPIVGYFKTGEPDDFARSVAELVGARVETRGGETHLILKGS